MNKNEFLESLKKRLSGLPKKDIDERLNFYGEMIDDRMEEGLSEQEAVCRIGTVDEVASQIIADIPLARLVKQKITPAKKLKAWEIILIVLGFPIWFPLMISAAVLALSLYIVLWSVIAVLWVAFVSLGAAGFGCAAGGVLLIACGNFLTGIVAIGAGLICVGLCIFMFFGCKETTRCILILTKKLALKIKNAFIKKEEA